jgi:aspartyl-tRNA(Asn)/glutamyl-tRNA(Gln) amidotransferase subunit C
VRRIAKLARLELTEHQVEEYQLQLSSVLGYMDRLAEVDVTDAEAMSRPSGAMNRLDADQVRDPGEVLSAEVLMKIAPATFDRFVSVPKVVGEGGA